MKKYILIILAAVLFSMTSCLEYAYSYKNDRAPALGNFNCTCYEWLKDKSETNFSLWFEAIQRAEMEDFYTEGEHTYFVLTDEQFNGWLTSFRYSCVAQVPKSVMRNFLLSYSLDGVYMSGDLTTNYITVPTCNEDYKMVMRLYPSASTASQNLHSMQAGWEQYDPTYYRLNAVVTSNLRCTNGVIHILNQKLLRTQN